MTIQDFLKIKLLGGGKFGKVHMVVEKKTGCLFAMKTMKKSMVRQYRMQAQLASEVKIQAYLDHPNIAKLYCFFADDQNVYLVC